MTLIECFYLRRWWRWPMPQCHEHPIVVPGRHRCTCLIRGLPGTCDIIPNKIHIGNIASTSLTGSPCRMLQRQGSGGQLIVVIHRIAISPCKFSFLCPGLYNRTASNYFRVYGLAWQSASGWANTIMCARFVSRSATSLCDLSSD